MESEIQNPRSEILVVSHGSPIYWQAVELRRRILRHPLRLDFTDEELTAESAETHIVAITEGQVIGCLVMVPKPEGGVKMRQVAVEPALQGRGLGTRLVSFCEEWARTEGFSRIELSARETAVRFYERLGYEIVGEPFVEVTIPHRKMVKKIATL